MSFDIQKGDRKEDSWVFDARRLKSLRFCVYFDPIVALAISLFPSDFRAADDRYDSKHVEVRCLLCEFILAISKQF